MKSRPKNERGMVSIMVASILMIIMSLITIAFARIMGREQRQALDRQLSTQAFYAAESGINDAIRALIANPTLNKDQCQTGGSFNYVLSDSVSYSCLLIDSSPTDYRKDGVNPIGRGEPTVAPLRTAQPFTQLDFWWDTVGSTGAPANIPNATAPPPLTTDGAWGNQVGILKLDLIPVDSYQRADLLNNAYSFILYPSTNGTNSFGALPGPVHKAGTGLVRCDTSLPPGELRCRATVVLAGPARNNYMMRLQSFYREINVEVNRVRTGPASPDLELINGQAVIDSTGKVSDVLRRIQVRVPLFPHVGLTPSFGLESADSICKRLVLQPSATGYNLSDVPSTEQDVCRNQL